LSDPFPDDAVGREFISISRSGKFLILSLTGDRTLVINPKLTGGIQYVPQNQRVYKRTCVRLTLANGDDLRYVDDRQMGQFYYVPDDLVETVPGLTDQGPDVLDDFTFDDFKANLKGFSGEIKGVLTRGRVIAGIGNAYADEILFDAMVYPFKRRKALSEDELRRIYQSSRSVIEHSIEQVRERMGDRIDHKVRDFLLVHNRGGEPCPRCGKKITELRANQRITSYCRSCQPGMLLKN
jgi:formamidopyrimidine-DNA glycosylase